MHMQAIVGSLEKSIGYIWAVLSSAQFKGKRCLIWMLTAFFPQSPSELVSLVLDVSHAPSNRLRWPSLWKTIHTLKEW